MTVTRRTLIASGLGATAVCAFPIKAIAAGQSAEFQFISDSNYEAGRRLTSLLAAQGRIALDPNGEIVRLLRTEAKSWGYGARIIGCTSHADYQIISSFLSRSGGTVEYARLCSLARKYCIEGSLSAAPAVFHDLLSHLQNIQSKSNRTGVLWAAKYTTETDADRTARFIG